MNKLHSLRKAIGLTLLLTLATQFCFAQSPLAWISSPAGNATNVALLPTITIRTHSPIVHSSLTYFYPDVDSSISLNPHPPTVELLPKYVADSLADSLYRYYSIRCHLTLVNDTTLSVVPITGLQPGMTYKVKISHLFTYASVAGCTSDTSTSSQISVSGESINFRTVYGNYRLWASSLDRKTVMKCNDSIIFAVNRPLPSLGLIDTSVVKIYKFNIDSVGNKILTGVPTVISIGEGNKSNLLYVKPLGGFIAGQSYKTKFNISYLNNDTLQNREYYLFGKNMFTVKMSNIELNTSNILSPNLSLPNAGETYYNISDSVTFAAFENYDNNYEFVKWECPQLPELNNNTNSVVRISQNCTNLTDLVVTAIFRKMDTLTLTVRDTNHVGVKVYNSLRIYLGGAGTYKIPKAETYYVVAMPDTSIAFKGWKSNTTQYNTSSKTPPPPSSELILRIGNNGRATGLGVGTGGGTGGTGLSIVPDYGDKDPVKKYCACVKYEWNDGMETCLQPGNMGIPNECLNTTDSSKVLVANPDFTGSCFIILGYYFNGNFVEFPTPVKKFTMVVPVGLAPNCNSLIIYLDRDKYNFTLETLLKDKREFLAANTDYDARVGRDNDVRVVIYRKCPSGYRLLGYTYIGDDRGSNNNGLLENYSNKIINGTSIMSSIQIPCNEEIELVPEWDLKEEGFNFVQWDNSPTYTYPTPNSSQKFTLTMNQHRKVQGIFNENFRLRKVGFYVANKNSGTVSTDKNTKQLNLLKGSSPMGSVEGDVNVWLAYNNMYLYANSDLQNARFGTEIQYTFNDPLDKSKILENPSQSSKSFSSIYCFDLSRRIDLGSYEGDYEPYPYNCDWTKGDRVLRLKLLSKRTSNQTKSDGTPDCFSPFGLPKGERFGMVVDKVYNTAGKLVKNPGSWSAESEMPGIDPRIVEVTPLINDDYSFGPDNCNEMFTDYRTGWMNSNNLAYGDHIHDKVPRTYPSDSACKNNTRYYGHIYLLDENMVDGNLQKDKMARSKYAFLSLITFDADVCIPTRSGGCSIKNEGDFAIEALDPTKPILDPEETWWERNWFSAKKDWCNAFPSDPDELGKYIWYYGWADWFGSVPWLSPFQEVETNGVRYKVRFRLKADQP